MPRHGDRRAAAPIENISAPVRSKWRRAESVKRETGGDRILGVANELAVLLRKAARLAHEQRMGIDNVEKAAAGLIKVDLVGRDQRAE